MTRRIPLFLLMATPQSASSSKALVWMLTLAQLQFFYDCHESVSSSESFSLGAYLPHNRAQQSDWALECQYHCEKFLEGAKDWLQPPHQHLLTPGFGRPLQGCVDPVLIPHSPHLHEDVLLAPCAGDRRT